MGSYSIVKLSLTFWKVKSGKGGFFNVQRDKQQRKRNSASRNKKSNNNKPHKQQQVVLTAAIVPNSSNTASQTTEQAAKTFWKVKSGQRLAFQRSAT